MNPTFAGAAATATLLLLTACSMPSTTTPDAPAELPSTAAPTDVPTDSASTPTSSPSAAVTPAPGAQPVAARPGSFAKSRVTAQLYPVRRSGATATVDLYVASQDPDGSFMLFDNLSDGNTETASKSLDSVDGIRLIDTTAKKAYLPAVTADGACVCSPDDTTTDELRSSVWVTVTFAAPPATVTTMSVSVPTFGTFTDVPVV